MADTVHLSLDDAHALALGALTASSFLFRIPFHVKALQNPDVRAVPELADRAPRVLHVDAKFGFAPLAL
jgi:hypothetical protein